MADVVNSIENKLHTFYVTDSYGKRADVGVVDPGGEGGNLYVLMLMVDGIITYCHYRDAKDRMSVDSVLKLASYKQGLKRNC